MANLRSEDAGVVRSFTLDTLTRKSESADNYLKVAAGLSISAAFTFVFFVDQTSHAYVPDEFEHRFATVATMFGALFAGFTSMFDRWQAERASVDARKLGVSNTVLGAYVDYASADLVFCVLLVVAQITSFVVVFYLDGWTGYASFTAALFLNLACLGSLLLRFNIARRHSRGWRAELGIRRGSTRVVLVVLVGQPPDIRRRAARPPANTSKGTTGCALEMVKSAVGTVLNTQSVRSSAGLDGPGKKYP